MAKDKSKISRMKMPGQIKVLPDKKLVDKKPETVAASNVQKSMFNSHWRILGSPKKED